MPAKQRVLDEVIRHRVDVIRFGRGEAEQLLELLAEEDAALIAMLRKRLPHVAAADIRKPRAQALMQAVKDMRAESLRELRDVMKGELRDFLRVEIDAIGRSMSRAAGGVVFDTVPMAELSKLLSRPFAVGVGQARTLSQWIDDIIRSDTQRIIGAIQNGIASGMRPDDVIRLISGTRGAGYADGLLATTRRHVETMWSTALNHVGDGAMQLWGEANAALVLGWQWVTMLDGNVCKRCRAQQGRFIPNGNRRPPAGMKMTDYRGGPPIHGRDRCVRVPIFDQRELARRL